MIYTAGIFLFNSKDEILLVHPTNAPHKTWSIPKGLVDENETVVEAAKRELLEETNVNLDTLKPVYFWHGENVLYKTKKKTLCPVFSKVLIGLNEIELKCNSLVEGKNFFENDQIKWFKVKEALEIIHESQVKALQQWC